MSGNAPVYDLIDDLHYSYAGANPAANAFSSKLQGVADVVTDAAAQPRGVFLPGSGYGYDGNGNMIGAGSVSAEYNILNLPTKLATPGGERKFEYVFGGGKYSAQLITGNPAIDETRHYLGGMEFKDGVLEAYNFGDGRVVWENGVPKFQYRLADHLGNTVVFFEDKNNNGCITTEEEATSPADLEIVQRLLYYPFGMALEGLGAWSAQPWQQYRYNGKERDTLTGWYEYGFRWYIDGIGRFTGVDPIADQFPWVSVYNYAENSPIANIDLHGLQTFYAANGSRLGQIKNENVNQAYYVPLGKEAIVSQSISAANNYLNDMFVGQHYLFTCLLNSCNSGLTNDELNMRSTLSMIRQAEAGRMNPPLDYNSWQGIGRQVFTKDTYEDNPGAYKKHPGPNRNSGGNSAAGILQFTEGTWNGLGVGEFHPMNQEKAGVLYMFRYHPKGFRAAISGDVEGMREHLTPWESLKPGINTINNLTSWFLQARANELTGNSNLKTPPGELLKEFKY